MLKKIREYYNIFGFKETLKKILRFAIFNFKTSFAKNGVYNLSSKELKNIVLKNKKIYVFAYNPIGSLDNQHLYTLVNELNGLGYNVIYNYINKQEGKKIIPVGYHRAVKEGKFYDFTEDDVVIFVNVFLEYEIIVDVAIEKKCKIIMVKDSKNDDWENEILVEKIIENSVYIFTPNGSMTKDIKKDMVANKIKAFKDAKNLIDTFFKNDKNYDKFYNNISIIVLNYNNKKVIKRCLDTLINYNKYNYEIIVVDNQSNDGSYEMIKDNYLNVLLYRNSKNGCSSGRNLGVLNSTKEYIVFLDSDQWVLHANWLDNYIDIIQDKDIGAIGWAAGWFNKKGFSYHTVDNFEYRYMPPMGLYRKDIGYIGTGGLMMRKELFEKIGGFDENYDPTCYEDTDLSLNIRNHGKEIVYCPYLGIEHLPHQSTKSGSEEHSKRIKEKGLYFVNKWKKINPILLKYIK